MQNKKSVKDTAFLVLALVVIIGSRFMPAMGGLSKDAWAVLGVFFGSLIMWITISIDWPSMITLLALGLLPLFGFSSAFLLFTFMLVYPLSKTNFVRRCTIYFITNRIARKGPWYFVCFLLAAVTFMGLFISPSVLFVAFMPFLEDIYQVLGLKKGGKAGNMIMMGSAFCISLSSGMTAIGHVWPTMAIGYYTAATGNDVNQFQYMAMGIPTGIILIVILILIFKFIYRPDDIKDIQPERAMSLRGTVPAADFKEKVILGVMALTVFLWVAPSLVQNVLPDFYATVNSWSTAMPPLLGCIILFVVRADGESIMNFKETVSKGVLWGSVLIGLFSFWLNSFYSGKMLGYGSWAQLKDILPSFGIALAMMAALYALSLTGMPPFALLAVQLLAGAGITIGLCELLGLEEYRELKNIVLGLFRGRKA